MPTTDNPTNPKIMCERDAEPDRVLIYRALLDRWLQGPPVVINDVPRNRAQNVLGEILGYAPQRITDWKHGKNGHIPPWWAICWLCDQVDAEVRISPTGIAVAWLGPDVAPEPEPAA